MLTKKKSKRTAAAGLLVAAHLLAGCGDDGAATGEAAVPGAGGAPGGGSGSSGDAGFSGAAGVAMAGGGTGGAGVGGERGGGMAGAAGERGGAGGGGAGNADVRAWSRGFGEGMVLGLQFDLGDTFDRLLEEVTLPLGQGDLFVLYTDGISEAMNRDGDCFGDQRLVDLAERYADLPSNDLQQHILDEVHTFAGDAAQHDDMTMVLVKVN